MIWRAIGIGFWTWSSPQWQRYTGQDAARSSRLGWLDVIHPDDRESAREHWEQAPATGEYDVEVRIQGQDGQFRWFQTRGRPVRDETGSIVEWIGTSTDVNDMRQLQSEQKVLVAELQHRTRNLIAVVHSICMQTLQRASTLQEFGDRFEDRLSALSRVQGLLSTSDQNPITIRRLLELELHALADGQIATQVQISGPHVIVRNSTAQTMALAVHELSTNALKHGALASPKGILRIDWNEHMREDAPWLCLEWCETGTLPVAGQHKTSGFGQVLIEQALPNQLGAETELRFDATGMQCVINLPLKHFRSEDLRG